MRLKGISHVHTHYSYDAQLSFSDYEKLAKKRDIQFILLSEHPNTIDENVFVEYSEECRKRSTDKLLFIPGIEYEAEIGLHIAGFGIEKYEKANTVSEIISTIRRNGGLSSYTHPVYQAFKKDLRLVNVDAIEIQNSKYDGNWCARASSYELFRWLKSQNPSLVATAGTDYHRTYDFKDSAYIFVDCNKLDKAEILLQIRNGGAVLGRPGRQYHMERLGGAELRMMDWAEKYYIPLREKRKWMRAYAKRAQREIFEKKNYRFFWDQIVKRLK